MKRILGIAVKVVAGLFLLAGFLLEGGLIVALGFVFVYAAIYGVISYVFSASGIEELEKVIGDVILFWLKAFFVVMTYRFAKQEATPVTKQNRTKLGKLLFCAKCTGIIFVIGAFVSYFQGYGKAFDSYVFSFVFIALIVPALAGAFEGFSSSPKSTSERTPEHWDQEW